MVDISGATSGDEVVGWLQQVLVQLPSVPEAPDDAARIDRIAALERVKAAAAAAQSREMVTFAASQEALQREAGLRVRLVGRGVAEQIALAVRCSPVSGAKRLTLTRALLDELPRTQQLLARGDISEWTATLVARESALLEPGDRRDLDQQLAESLPSMGPARAAAAARRLAITADPEAAVRRAGKARADRFVSVRPAPDTMAIVSALLPVEQGVAVWANLRACAMAERATGDPRGIGQLMADTLVERATGQVTASAVPVEIGLVMSADALLDAGDAPAQLAGYGPIPALLGRQIATEVGPGGTAEARRYVRRIFTDPVDDTVAHVDTRRRRFDGPLARLIRLRDQRCRDPFCDAPIHDLDHVEPFAAGGPTSARNGQGLCRRGNLVKQLPAWSGGGDARLRLIVTPTGHAYSSRPPPALGAGGDAVSRRRRNAIRRLQSLNLRR